MTQGAAKPTHFYVAENTSNISKQAILDFTYALCYNYPNWADSIKVPAPCMLADKIAIYRTEIGNIPASLDLQKLPFFLWVTKSHYQSQIPYLSGYLYIPLNIH